MVTSGVTTTGMSARRRRSCLEARRTRERPGISSDSARIHVRGAEPVIGAAFGCQRRKFAKISFRSTGSPNGKTPAVALGQVSNLSSRSSSCRRTCRNPNVLDQELVDVVVDRDDLRCAADGQRRRQRRGESLLRRPQPRETRFAGCQRGCPMSGSGIREHQIRVILPTYFPERARRLRRSGDRDRDFLREHDPGYGDVWRDRVAPAREPAPPLRRSQSGRSLSRMR